MKVQGQGTYELKITNLINPYTMKATPLQPSLLDPTYLLSQGVGSNNKAISLSEDQISSLIVKKNNGANVEFVEPVFGGSKQTNMTAQERLSKKIRQGGGQVKMLSFKKHTNAIVQRSPQ
mmetsp:Transcript_1831/g.1279  ORF Transcript_1831/g.1279 Transcript_1831/m.1279 type:complete len:120 (+) Transcript_1831:249-608(+)